MFKSLRSQIGIRLSTLRLTTLSLTTLSLAFGAILAPAAASAGLSKMGVIIGSSVGGGLAGVIAGNAKTGEKGPAGDEGTAGTSYTFPTGTATLTFTFADTGAGGSSFKGVVIAPDQTTYETAAIAPGSVTPEVIVIGPSPAAPIGHYTVGFYQSDTLGTTAVGSCVVSNDCGVPPANYLSNLPAISAEGNQSTFEFMYDTTLYP